jgi:hypothetical protein
MSCPDCARSARAAQLSEQARVSAREKAAHQARAAHHFRAEHHVAAEQLIAARAEWQGIRAELEAERDAASTELRYYRVWLQHAQDRATTLQYQLDAATAELVRLRRAKTPGP